MLHIIISGSVHGVGFRQFIKLKAKSLNLTGWVKNLPASRPASMRGEQDGFDDRIEAVLQGRTEDIDKMMLICRKGPFLANVKKIEIEELPDQLFENFDIIKT